MMSYPAIKAVGLGKRYTIGTKRRRYKTVRDLLSDRFKRSFNGSGPDSWEKKDQEFWALKDVSFEIQPGEVVGIIGRNGAGKSTLLKTLSRITEPTAGYVDINGRVGALLEVGTGFHLELTGRENVYLSGSILGMNKLEIDRHFDEIVAFSEVERFIDTPVKHYSSGMYLRLAFGVAAHLNPEILLIDEVLAVGDANFQKKCLGKMGDVARKGRTILFVSHNMSAIQELCPRGILIESGEIAFDGRAMDCVAEYYNRSNTPGVEDDAIPAGRPLEVSGLKINGGFGRAIETGSGFTISVDLSGRDLRNPKMFFIVENMMGQSIIHNHIFSKEVGLEMVNGKYRIELTVPPLWLSPGVYSLYFKFLCSSVEWEGRAFSERLMLEVHGEMENTGKAVLNPEILWDFEGIKVGSMGAAPTQVQSSRK